VTFYAESVVRAWAYTARELAASQEENEVLVDEVRKLREERRDYLAAASVSPSTVLRVIPRPLCCLPPYMFQSGCFR
jgi:hypothetical protein